VVPATTAPSMVRLVNIELNSPCDGAPACRVRARSWRKIGARASGLL
jgi:hypothetical protein